VSITCPGQNLNPDSAVLAIYGTSNFRVSNVMQVLLPACIIMAYQLYR